MKYEVRVIPRRRPLGLSKTSSPFFQFLQPFAQVRFTFRIADDVLHPFDDDRVVLGNIFDLLAALGALAGVPDGSGYLRFRVRRAFGAPWDGEAKPSSVNARVSTNLLDQKTRFSFVIASPYCFWGTRKQRARPQLDRKASVRTDVNRRAQTAQRSSAAQGIASELHVACQGE